MIRSMPVCKSVLLALVVTGFGASQTLVSFSTKDGGLIYADRYGGGDHGIVLAHGGQFNKESWTDQARALRQAGFAVLAIDFRGYGQSRGPAQGRLHDVLAAVRYLRKSGAKTVSVVGGSMGGDIAAEAAETAPGEIDRLVLLGAGAYTTLTQMTGRKLFIIARDDFMGDERIPRLPRIRERFDKASDPRELVILEGSAHAQHIFATDQAEQLMREILRFLWAP